MRIRTYYLIGRLHFVPTADTPAEVRMAHKTAIKANRALFGSSYRWVAKG